MNAKTREGDEKGARRRARMDRARWMVFADIDTGFMKTRLGSRITFRGLSRERTRERASSAHDLTPDSFFIKFSRTVVERPRHEIGPSQLSPPAGSR